MNAISLIILFAIIPVIEHATERIKEILAEAYDNHGISPYAAYWLSPLIAYVLSLILVLLMGLHDAWMVAFIPTGGSMVYYEVSTIWKRRKRESIPMRTKAAARDIRGKDQEIKL